MNKINFSFPVYAIDGSEIKQGDKVLHLNEIVATVLMQHTQNPIKFYDWAMTMYKTGSIEVDDSDKELLKSFIENQKSDTGISLTNLVKAQAMRALDGSFGAKIKAV